MKKTIFAVLSSIALIPDSFIPSIPRITKDLYSSGPVVNFEVSLSILTTSLSSLFWATYSGFCAFPSSSDKHYICKISQMVADRSVHLPFSFVLVLPRWNYLWNFPTPMTFCIMQASSASAGMSVGSGAISDVYRLEEHGPFSSLTRSSCWGHCDVLFHLAIHGLAIRPLPFRSIGVRFRGVASVVQVAAELTGKYPRSVWLNPLSGLALLRSPNVMAGETF